jgi:LCP family protein required for cell wall assembly
VIAQRDAQVDRRPQPPDGTDYPTRARLRATRPSRRASNREPTRPYAESNPPRQPAPAPKPPAAAQSAPARPAAAQPLAGSPTLKENFDRVKRDQAAKTRRRRIRGPQSRRAKLFVYLPLVFLLVAGGVLGKTIFNATRAYQNIFVAQAPHADIGKFTVQETGNGEKVIVPAATGTAAAAAATTIPDWNGKDRITLLLLGVDQRETEASRSDTMILVNIDPVTKSASMMAIPRDLKVIVPGYGVHKINAAYAFGDADKVPGGGPGLAMRTIEANFGITVDYYATVNFAGFTKIIDTVGGLTIDVPYPIKDDAYPAEGNNYMRVYFKTGWQHMNGTQALEYARTRHDDGDELRSVRQQQVLLALRQQAISLDLISKAPDLIAELGDTIRTDMPLTKALQLAKLGTQIDTSAIKEVSLNDALTPQELTGQPYFLIADWNAVGKIMSGFMGTTVVPPMSALANPNYHVQIVIQDGTLNPGLGSRVAAVIKANGFTNIAVTDKPDPGNYPNSSISSGTGDLTTAYLIAGLIGVPVDAINVDDSVVAAPTIQPASPVASAIAGTSPIAKNAVAFFPTPTPMPGGATPVAPAGQVVIVLGDDTKDPAYFTNAPYDDETSDGPTATPAG